MLLRLGGALTAAATLSPMLAQPLAHAIGPSSQFRFGVLNLGASNRRQGALRRLAWEVTKRTAIDIDINPIEMALNGKSLAQSPFLVLSGDREFAIPSNKEISALRQFLTFGGFLLIDSGEGATDGAFDGSVRQLLDQIFPRPQKNLELVSQDHVLYKSFYLINRPLGRLAISPTLEAVVRDDRAVVVYSHNDLLGAWMRDDLGNYEYSCEPGGERQREFAFRVGINLVMYALCLDYKSDQVHVPAILKRRRWRPTDGAKVESVD